MFKHDFLFQPSRWVGEGKITFSTSPDHLRFYTRWIIEEGTSSFSQCVQSVEIQGGVQSLQNLFFTSNVTLTSFEIEINNELVGKVNGKGVIDDKTIAWEFRGGPLEGFEVYELQENGDYMVHAEYSSADQFRTIIDGRIWKKS
jgi:hypothetical protein